jgi:AcrR family transcriptional regulator
VAALPAIKEPSVLDRLVSAADTALLDVDIDAVTIQAVAVAAGVSRATAFRHMGTREDMIVAVAMLRGARYARTCAIEMDRCTSVFDKIETAYLYLTRELLDDPVMRALFMVQTAADIGDEASELAMATLGPVIDQGRANGIIRTDVSAERIMAWIVEQLYLAIQQTDRTDAAVRERVRLFLIPALTPDRITMSRSGHWTVQLDAVSDALSHAVEATNVLREHIVATNDGREV